MELGTAFVEVALTLVLAGVVDKTSLNASVYSFFVFIYF